KPGKEPTMPQQYTLTKDQRALAFDPDIPPVLEIDPGDEVTFQTGDVAYERLSKGETVEAIGLENFNAVTGPVLVRGAQPGDALRVEILDIQVERAWSVWLPQFGGLGAYADRIQVMQTPIRDGRVWISPSVSVPLAPMIGCLAVAPAEGRCSTFMPAYPWGGNMDLREMSPGATLWLPVQVPGARFSMGDLHAAMGSAEVTWVSLEASGQATLRFGLEPGWNLRTPRLRAGQSTYCVGMGESLLAAQQDAINQAYALLQEAHGMEPFDAYAYASAVVHMRLGGPASSMVLAEVPDPGSI
ncbi:MAG: acetamidase/formamidase, partial [Chloroflexi bacterium]